MEGGQVERKGKDEKDWREKVTPLLKERKKIGED